MIAILSIAAGLALGGGAVAYHAAIGNSLAGAAVAWAMIAAGLWLAYQVFANRTR